MRLHGPALSLDGMVWINDYARQAERLHPGRMAIVGDAGTLTYRELDQASDRFAGWLQAQGLPQGARVAYLGNNSELMFPVFFGCIRAGAALVPIDWRLAAADLAQVLDDSQAQLLVVAPECADAARAACARLAGAPRLLATEAEAGECLRAVLLEGAVPASGPHNPDAACLQLYTRGAAGRPQGVLQTHRKLSVACWAQRCSPQGAGWHDGDVLLSAQPNFRASGLSWMLTGLLRAVTCVLTADPSPAHVLALRRQHAVTRTFAPSYGMAEVGGPATCPASSPHGLDRPARAGSAGTLLPGFEMEIRDPQGRPLGALQPGEIHLRTPTLMLGYWQQPGATADAIDIEGWYRTGDRGHADADGHLFLSAPPEEDRDD